MTEQETRDRPSPHFTWDEVACWNRLRNARGEPIPFQGVPPGGLIAVYPLDWREARLIELLDECETIRAWWHRPIALGSCFRRADYNAAIGGAVASQHVFGRATDLHTPEGVLPREFYDRIRAYATSAASGSRIRGVGWYAWGVHIDTRPSGVVRLWRSTRPGAEIVPVEPAPSARSAEGGGGSAAAEG